MAYFKYAEAFQHASGPVFDLVFTPGRRVPYSGIYRCTGCGDEVALNKGTPFPSQNHHQHRPHYTRIRWQLVAAAVQR